MPLHVGLALPRDPDLAGPVDRDLRHPRRLQPGPQGLEVRAQRSAAAPPRGLIRWRALPGVEHARRHVACIHGSTSSICSRSAALKPQKSRSRFRNTLIVFPCGTVVVGGMFTYGSSTRSEVRAKLAWTS